MELAAAIKQRHAVRLFSDQAVTNDDLLKITALAQQAPSWANSQPWKIYYATGNTAAKIREQHFAKIQAGTWANADLANYADGTWSDFTQDNMSTWSITVDQFLKQDRAEMTQAQQHLFHAPVLAYLTIPVDSPAWSLYDLGAFAENLMLAATDLGIASIPAFEIVKYPTDIRKIMDIPKNELVAMGIALGYPLDHQVNELAVKRRPLSEIMSIKD